MTTPLFHLTTVDDGDAQLAPLQIALECLAQIDEWHLRRSLRRAEKGLSRTVIPPLYVSRVRYRAREPGPEDWLDVPAALQQGLAAPEDLVAWRVAELRLAGQDADPIVALICRDRLRAAGVTAPPGTGPLVHYAVRLQDGSVEDPAVKLGAKAPPIVAPSSRPLFHLSLPDTEDDAHFAPLQVALEGLAQIDEYQIRRSLRRAEQGLPGEIVPPLYASGVVYEEEAPGHEDWLDALAVVKARVADCEDLAAYRVAELRVAGFDVEPVIKYQWIPRDMMIKQGYPPDKLPARGVWLVHCCVRWNEDGRIEDPSKILGMGGNFTETI